MRGIPMSKLVWLLAISVLLAPLAAAQDAPSVPAEAEVSETPLWQEAGAALGDGLSAAGEGTSAAAAAVGDGFAAAAAALGDAARAIGRGIASAASLGWTALVSIVSALASVITFLGAQLAALGALLASALASGARAGFETIRENPKESAIVAGSAAGFGGLAWLAKRLGLLGFIPLYTRLAPGEMLDNEARSAIYEHVKANPGAHPSGIAETLDLGWGTVVYHLARLETSKLVTVKPGPHRKCYFAVGAALDAQGRAAVAAMATDKARVIVQAVRDAPGVTQKDLAERLGMSQALMSWHVKRLAANGILLTSRAGRANALRVAEHVPMMAPAAPPVAAIVA